MATTKSMILDARIGKSDIPKVYQKIAPKYDIWGKLAESKARNHCLEPNLPKVKTLSPTNFRGIFGQNEISNSDYT
jgi:hypothetical protein